MDCHVKVEQFYICIYCDGMFKSRHAFEEHSCAPNLDGDLLKCDICPAVFKLPGGLKTHLGLHKGIR